MKNTNILDKKVIKYVVISLLALSIVACAILAFSMGGGCSFLAK